MLPEKDEDAANLLALCLLLAAIMGVITALVIWLGGDKILYLLNAQGLTPYLWLVPISVFLGGIFLALNCWNSRTKRFGRLSIARVVASVAMIGTQLGVGFAGYPTGGSLIAAGLMGSAASTLMLGEQIRRTDKLMLRKYISAHDIVAGLKRYKRFPIFDTWSGLLNSTSWQLPTFLLSAFFSTTVVGYYALGMMVLQLPTSLISGAISQIFFQRAAEAKFNDSLSQTVQDTFLRLAIIGALPISLLFMTGSDLFTVVFGAAWAEAGIYVQILSPWMFFVFIFSPMSTIFSILEKQNNFLLLNIIIFITRAGALLLGGLSGDARIALILFALVGVIDYAGMGLWIFYMVDIPISKVIKKLRKPAVYCIFALCFLTLTKWIHLSPQIIIMLDIIIAILYYILLKRNIQYTL
jgi:O-antigen/teichoic acid export membrane protein